MNLVFVGNIEFQLFHQQRNFDNGFRGNRLRQHIRSDRGIISCFHIDSKFDMLFADQTQLFQKN